MTENVEQHENNFIHIPKNGVVKLFFFLLLMASVAVVFLSGNSIAPYFGIGLVMGGTILMLSVYLHEEGEFG